MRRARAVALTVAAAVGLGMGLYLGNRTTAVEEPRAPASTIPVAGPVSPSPTVQPTPFVTTSPTVAPSRNRPPEVGPVLATYLRPVTVYSVRAEDPDGDGLTFAWSKTGTSCGTFQADGNIATWSHPEPPCPEERAHPARITVVVSDGHGNRIRAVYPHGSAAGEGPPPAGT